MVIMVIMLALSLASLSCVTDPEVVEQVKKAASEHTGLD